MNRPTFPHSFVQAPSHDGITEGYMPGFGNDLRPKLCQARSRRVKTARKNVTMGYMANNSLEQRSQRPAIKMNAHGVTAFVPL